MIQRKGPVNVVCSLVEGVHGKLGPDPETAPTMRERLQLLLVFQFRFIPQKHSQRILRASIHVEFSGFNAQWTPPTVWAIASYDTLTVVLTMEHEEDKRGTTLVRLRPDLSRLVSKPISKERDPEMLTMPPS